MNIPNTSGTKCPKCESTFFELVEDYPSNANYKMWYMRCSSLTCKTLVHVFPYLDTNTKLEKLSEEVAKIKAKLQIFH